jgi:hypothetical protein
MMWGERYDVTRADMQRASTAFCVCERNQKMLPGRTKVLAKFVLDGGASRQVVGGCKVSVEAANKVNHGAWDGAASLAREQRVPLQQA